MVIVKLRIRNRISCSWSHKLVYYLWWELIKLALLQIIYQYLFLLRIAHLTKLIKLIKLKDAKSFLVELLLLLKLLNLHLISLLVVAWYISPFECWTLSPDDIHEFSIWHFVLLQYLDKCLHLSLLDAIELYLLTSLECLK